MLDFGNYSFLWALAIGVLISLFYGARAVLGFRQVSEDAASDYDYKLSEGMLPEGQDKAAYLRAYKRAHAPRAPAYVATALLCVCLLYTSPSPRDATLSRMPSSA